MAHHLKSFNVTKTHLQNVGKEPHDHLKWCQKSIWQNSTPFHGKNIQQTNRGKLPQHNGTYMWKASWLTSYSIVKNWKLFLNIKMKTILPILTTSIQHWSLGPSQSNDARKRNKRHLVEKEELKLSLVHKWHNLICKNPRPNTNFRIRKDAGYKTNI